MRERSVAILVLLTFLGMVGLYFGLWKAYQLYVSYKPQLDKLQTSASSLSGLLGSLTGK